VFGVSVSIYLVTLMQRNGGIEMSNSYKRKKKTLNKIRSLMRQGLGVIFHDGQVVPYCKKWGERATEESDKQLRKWGFK